MLKMSVCIDVPEMARAMQFYTRALGLEKVQEGKDHAELKVDNTTVYLAERAAGTKPLLEGDAIRQYNRHWTPIHLDFVVPNLDHCIANIKEFGGNVEGSKDGDWGAVAFCSDPFGNGFCVMQMNT